MSSIEIEPTESARTIDRRTILKGAAWATPIVLVTAAVPAAVASDDPSGAECMVLPAGSFTTSGQLYVDGAAGTPSGGTPAWPGAPTRTTGWTPIDANDAAHIDASWWTPIGTDLATDIGFMSQDDRNNSASATDDDVVTVSTTFTFDGKAGLTYSFVLPIKGGSDWLGPQYLSIGISGLSVSAQEVFTGFRGDRSIAVVPAIYDSYTTQIPDSGTVPVTIQPVADGLVTFDYVFSLPRVIGGSRQNADVWVGIPTLVNCV